MGCCQGKCLGSGGYLGKEFLALQEQTEAQRNKRYSVYDMIGKKEQNFDDEYLRIRTIGQGSFGEVIEAQHKKSLVHRAVKIINKSAMNQQEKHELMKEIEILRTLDHPNIMRVYEYYDTPENMYIVCELYQGGELLKKITQIKNFNERKAADIMKQILSAVCYYQKKSIVHRDLKPANILFDAYGEKYVVKIVDFGVSMHLEPGKLFEKPIGTLMFMAPEMIKESYDHKCDIWACGVILYIILSGQMPFNGKTTQAISNQILKGSCSFQGDDWMYISDEAKRFVQRLMTLDYTKRPTAAEALKDPWITKVEKDSINEEPLIGDALARLRSYKVEQKLSEAFWVYLSTFFSQKQERDEFLTVFQELDIDGNGVLSYEELRRGFSAAGKFGYTDAELAEIIKQVDTNGNGVIDYSEFVTSTISRKALLTKERLKALFDLLDKNGDGYLDISEVKTIFSNDLELSERRLKEMMLEMNPDRDERGISYENFEQIMLQIADDSPSALHERTLQKKIFQ